MQKNYLHIVNHFSESIWIYSTFFYVFQETVCAKKINATFVQLLVRSREKFLCAIWNLGTKTYPKFVKLSSFDKIFKPIFKNINKI